MSVDGRGGQPISLISRCLTKCCGKRITLIPEPNLVPKIVTQVLSPVGELLSRTAVILWSEYSGDLVKLPSLLFTVTTIPESEGEDSPKEKGCQKRVRLLQPVNSPIDRP